MKTLTCVFGALLLVASSSPASAQATRPGRGYISLNALSQPANPALSDHFDFEENVETATVDVRYPSKLGIGGDGGAGFRLWKQLGVGLAVSYVSSTGAADVEARIPHPFIFGQPRAISGSEGSISRAETGAHVQVLYFVPAGRNLRFILSAGPSRVSLEQEAITEVHYSDTYPYDTAAFTRATTRTVKGSAVGFNVGADVQWMFSRTIGVGALVRFTRAQVELDIATGRRLPVDTGGVQAGGGLRIRF